MGKTDMSYYKDLILRIGGANLGSAAAKTLSPVKGLSGNILGAAKGAKGFKKKIIKKKKGGKVK